MTSVRMPDDLMCRLDAAAERLRRSKGWIIKDAVREYLERADMRLRRLEETKDALAELNAGELIDGDEVLAWLDLDSAKSLWIYRRSGSWLRAIT
jgi:predicted transcriptional regulator